MKKLILILAAACGLSAQVTINGVPNQAINNATSSAKGVVQGDGSTITITGGVESCTTATTSQTGCVKPDGTTITISGGTISASGGVFVPTGSNTYPPVSATQGALLSTAPITISPTTTPGNVAGIVGGAATQGQVFLFQSGTYKNQTWSTSADNQVFMCAVNQTCTFINSVDISTGWTGAGPYSRTVSVTDHDDMYPCLATYTCNLDVDIFIDNVPQIRVPFVTNCATTNPPAGRWAYNGTTACLGTNPATHIIEINDYAYPDLIDGNNTGIRVTGFVVRKYPTAAQHGAIGGGRPGTNWTVDHCDVQLSHGVGVVITGGSINNCTLNNNGQEGFSDAFSAGSTFFSDIVNYNNYARYDYDAEAGAGKWGRMRGLHVYDNEFGFNYGVGPWVDTDGTDMLFENNYVHDNFVNGLMVEISRSCTIRNNHIANNGGGANAGYQIFVSNTGPCEVYGNDISWNKANIYYGVYVLQAARGIDTNNIPWSSAGTIIRNNYFTCGALASGCAAIFGNFTAVPGSSTELQAYIQADWNLYFDLGTPGGMYFQIGVPTYSLANWISMFGEDINAQTN